MTTTKNIIIKQRPPPPPHPKKKKKQTPKNDTPLPPKKNSLGDKTNETKPNEDRFGRLEATRRGCPVVGIPLVAPMGGPLCCVGWEDPPHCSSTGAGGAPPTLPTPPRALSQVELLLFDMH